MRRDDALLYTCSLIECIGRETCLLCEEAVNLNSDLYNRSENPGGDHCAGFSALKMMRDCAFRWEALFA
ncbi:MAG: hypothetical protein IKP40_03210 [Clostridia bacterium]|nr:hypothetical protein [Clostridia bacterium]